MEKAKGKGKGGIQVLRIMTHPKLGGGLLAHDSGRVRPDNVREVPVGELAIVPYTTRREELAAKAALQAMLDERAARAAAGERVGRMPHHAVELVFQGAGRYGPDKAGVDHSWPREKEEDFERRCLDWAKQILGPESVIAVACAHRDELTHHLHVIAIPIRNGRLGWCHVRDAALHNMDASETMRAQFANEAPPQRRKGTRRYARLQDAFHDQVACFFGLDRGEKATGRRHQAIDRFEAIKHRADGEAARAQREREATAVAVEEREAAECDRDQARRETQALREHVTELEQHGADVERKVNREMELLDLARERRWEEEAPDNARAAQRLQRIVYLEQHQSKLERARDAAVGERDEARRQTAAEREATAAVVGERDAAVEVRDQALREVRDANRLLAELRGRIARTWVLLESLVRAVDAVLRRARRDAAELAATIQEHLTAAAEAAEQRRQAEAAAEKSRTLAERAKDEEVAATEKTAAAEQTLEETRAAVADDRAVGLGLLSRRGRKHQRKLAHERQLRKTAEGNFEAELVQAEARTAAETKRADEEAKRADEEAKRADEEAKRADEEAKRADEAEERVEDLNGALRSKQIVDAITAGPGRVSEVERVRKLRAHPAPTHPAPAPAPAPAQPGPGIGE